jgi:hypothetical protein
MARPINSTKAAALVQEQTGRPCSRQNLEKHMERGALMNSPCVLQHKPWRVDAETVVEEFLRLVAPFQVEAVQPTAKREPALEAKAVTVSAGGGDLPGYNESRARSEYEKANLLELERKQKEGQLLRREDVQQAWSAAVNITRTKLLGIPSVAKQRIPHLDLEEVEVLTGLLREALEELAAGEMRR